MKVIRVHAWGEAPRLDDIPPPALTSGHTLVRMHAATVGHIDRSVWSGTFLRHPPLPYVPGVEAAGVVVSSGRFAPGQRVWLRGQGLGIVRDGTWRELIDAPDEAIGELPDAVSFALGSAFFYPCTSAWVALHDVAQLREGERVIVTGASGAVGSIAVQLACEAGARVTAVCFDEAQAARLPGDVEHMFASDLKPEADVLIDTVGGAALLLALRGVAPGGRAVLVGYAGGTETKIDLPELLQRDVSLLPLNMLRREGAGRAAAPALLDRIAQGRLALAVSEFPLEDAARALQWIAQRGHTGRAVLKASLA
jgi:NADPH2:quinone reductase